MNSFQTLEPLLLEKAAEMYDQPHSSSLFGVLVSHDYEYKNTKAAKLAARLVREVLEDLRNHTTLQSIAFCFPYKTGYVWPSQAQELYANKQIDFGKCGNKNACPYCARRHGAICRKKLLESLDCYFQRGFLVWSQTLDLGFEPQVSSRKRYKILGEAFTYLLKLSSVSQLRSKYEVAYFRVIEETWIDGALTPHMHIIWVFRPGTSDQAAADFIDSVSRSWRRIRVKTDGVMENDRTIFSQPLERKDMEITAWYLQKSFWLDGLHSIEEGARDVRPLDHLLSFRETGDMGSLEKWKEYEWASFRLQKYKFSRNWVHPT